jgi:lysine 2,3-aminomutase
MGMNLSWKSDFQSAFKNSSDLFSFLGWKDDSPLVEKKYPLFIPQRLAQKIKTQGPTGILAREFLPDQKELSEQGMIDPIGDKEHYKAPQLIHRYYSRALFTPTSVCPVHCRYCFRKNELNANDELFAADFDKTIEYLKQHPEISEIIFTGGDPLTLSNEKLRKYLEAFSEIESLKDIRFHTRYPVILPSRLDQDFLDLMKEYNLKFRTITLAIHANHVDEFDEESNQKIKELSQTGIQLLSQTVLLKDVNNNLVALTDLMNHFISLKVRPYYLHHPDQVQGGLHFYLGLEEGRLLYGQLRTKLPGWGIPHYVIDIPGGAGKVGAYNPETTQFSGQLLGIQGEKIVVQEPDLTAF